MANVKTFTRQIDSTTWLMLGLMMLPGLAHAAGGDPINQGLQWLIDLLTSGIARSCAILAIAVLGYLAWAGRLQARNAGFAIGGIVLVFGAVSIADAIIAVVK
ncbi:TrbC/VirB2 family protein [Escherichia coli]|uniref:TrbC/VirB2 family protein n=1 Tax=Escherichia coli TaxID=562 RepID=UPI001D06DF2E|nr:TrbC/VirB2 family protein [Escherichia coli]MCB7519537.1 TrbC/VirB2 family protein [Escherichia coli]MCB7550354.1 TrbC/VirB2 family protein [Escherichia coli]